MTCIEGPFGSGASPNAKSAPPSATTSDEASQSTPFPLNKDALIQTGTTPDLPPQMASVRSHTADDIVKMMNRTPLFMTSLDDNEGEDGQNVELEAIRALQYEGTPAEIAKAFKEQGNEMAKLKRWKDGREFYTKGIAVLAQKQRDWSQLSRELGCPQSESDKAIELKKEEDLRELCYVNRALCHLELRNYRSTTLDCAAALRINPKNIKAYYRSSCALLAIDKIDQALDSCDRGLHLDPQNAAVKALRKRIETRQKTLVLAHEKKQVENEFGQRRRLMLATALRARNIQIRKTAQPPDLEDAAIHLAPDPVSPTSTLKFPVILLYPLQAQSDFIKAFSETETVPQHLEYIFPAPWDKQHEYTKESVEFYMETGTGGLVKVGKNVTLGKVLGSDGIEIVDGLIRINVLLKGRTTGWLAEMKKMRGKQDENAAA